MTATHVFRSPASNNRLLLRSQRALITFVVLIGGVGATDVRGAQAVGSATWSAAGPVTGAVTLNDAALAASPGGQTLLLSAAGADRSVTPGNANTTQNTAGTQAEFLPNGDAIVNEGNNYLAYQFADGATGGLIRQQGGIYSYAADADELLVLTSGTQSNTVGAASYTIGAGGTLTPNGGVVNIYTGNIYGPTAVGLDNDGQADVVILAELNDYNDQNPTEIRRLNQGGAAVWQTPHQLAADVNNGIQFVAAPGGRMLATWTDYLQNNAGNSEPDLFATVREPGQAFGPIQTLLSRQVASGQSADIIGPRAAAGPDGTVALTAQTDDCPNTNTGTVATSVITVWVAPPGSNGGLASTQIPSSTLTKHHASSVTALAAGDGQALVGLHSVDITSDPNGDFQVNPCGQTDNTEEVSGTLGDDAVLTGGGDHNFGSGTFMNNVPTGGGGSRDTSNDVSITAASLDSNGYAAVVGSLDTSNTVQFATYGAVGSASPSTSPTTPPSSAPPTVVAGTTTTPPVTTSTPPATPGSASKPLPQKQASITSLPATAVANGVESITVTNTTSGVENLTITELAYASGLTTAAPHAILAGESAPKIVTIARLTARLKPHQRTVVKLHLSGAAAKVLKAHKLKVILKTTCVEKGFATHTVSRMLTLHAR